MSTPITTAMPATTAEPPTKLILTRKLYETIVIGDEVRITVVDIRGDQVRLSITAPRSVPVHRKEIYEAIRRESRAAGGVRDEERTAEC